MKSNMCGHHTKGKTKKGHIVHMVPCRHWTYVNARGTFCSGCDKRTDTCKCKPGHSRRMHAEEMSDFIEENLR